MAEGNLELKASSVPGKHRRKRTAAEKRRIISNIVLQLLAMVGVGLLLYPNAADWVNSLSHNSEISGYVKRVEGTPNEQRQELLEKAYRYNEELEPGPLTDPYLTETESAAVGTDLYAAYEEMLRVSGTEAIGTVNYPGVDIALPIYHGTEDKAISTGAGHMYGTSLPVGGPSTRAVLTSHSGLPHAKLFTNLHDAQIGDVFWVSVLGEHHHYQVREIETVLPNETESLTIVEGEDWVTLFTCTPIGVNSHRLLVHAERIATPEESVDGMLNGDGLWPGFPWWLVIFLAASGAIAAILFLPGRKKKTSRQDPENSART